MAEEIIDKNISHESTMPLPILHTINKPYGRKSLPDFCDEYPSYDEGKFIEEEYDIASYDNDRWSAANLTSDICRKKSEENNKNNKNNKKSSSDINKSDDFIAGEKVQLTDKRNKKVTIQLLPHAQTQTDRGFIRHDDIIGKTPGIKIYSFSRQECAITGRQLDGWEYVVMRPRFADYILSMPRGAQIMYPKDIAQLIVQADIRPGLKVVESGGGSGALSLGILNALGSYDDGSQLITIEKREEFAHIAQANVEIFYRGFPAWWTPLVGSFDNEASKLASHSVDRIVFDLLDPWNQLREAERIIRYGGIVGIYVTTTTQMNRVCDALRESHLWSDPEITESMERHWKAEGLSVRPEHSMIGHTGFLITARRLAHNTMPLEKRRHGSKDVWHDIDECHRGDSLDNEYSNNEDQEKNKQLNGMNQELGEERLISDKKIRRIIRDLRAQLEVIKNNTEN